MYDSGQRLWTTTMDNNYRRWKWDARSDSDHWCNYVNKFPKKVSKGLLKLQVTSNRVAAVKYQEKEGDGRHRLVMPRSLPSFSTYQCSVSLSTYCSTASRPQNFTLFLLAQHPPNAPCVMVPLFPYFQSLHPTLPAPLRAHRSSSRRPQREAATRAG